MIKTKILYAEDDETLAFLTKDNLENHGFEVVHCADGKRCIETFDTINFDVCVLDIMMPYVDGFEVATHIRKKHADIPILFLSAKILKEDRIKGLKLGADDYLVKPFSIEELVLKIEIFSRRSMKNQKQTQQLLHVGNCQLDLQNYVFSSNSSSTTLTQRESELLQYFIENKNMVLKREQILKHLWGDDDYFMGRSLDVFISRLRKILGGEKNIFIENLHGIGFRFAVS